MKINKIKSGYKYEHEEHGEVLVSAIGKMYEEWDIAGEDHEHVGITSVYFYKRFDGYGGLGMTPLAEDTVDFAESVTEEIGEHEYVDARP